MRRLRALERSTSLGPPLSSIVELETDYRFLTCGSYLAFYRDRRPEVYIDRVLYGRRDYLSLLFEGFDQAEDA